MQQHIAMYGNTKKMILKALLGYVDLRWIKVSLAACGTVREGVPREALV